jgi:hypothetical protein
VRVTAAQRSDSAGGARGWCHGKFKIQNGTTKAIRAGRMSMI